MRKLLLLLIAIAVSTTFAGNVIYVDANAEDGGDGMTRETAFKTIREGVNAADEGDSVYVLGGAERVYSIANANDAVLIDEARVSLVGCDMDWVPITHYSQTNSMPHIALSNTYAKDCKENDGRVTDPIGVITNNVTISGLKFTFGNMSFMQQNYGGSGLICCYRATNFTLRACAFLMPQNETGKYKGAGTDGIIKGSTDNNIFTSSYLTIESSYFQLVRYRDMIVPFSTFGEVVDVRNSCFVNVDSLYKTTGDHNKSTLNFVSNIVYNCANDSDGERKEFLSSVGNTGNHFPISAEIAYNLFVHDSGDNNYFAMLGHGGRYGGGYNKSVKIHHNTVIGYDAIFVSHRRNSDDTDLWTPDIYNNLILLKSDGCLIYEEGDKLWKDNAPCSYKDGSAFTNNAYLATTIFNGGTATLVEGYDLLSKLKVENNVLLETVPEFISTDISSPDFYRFKQSKNQSLCSRRNEYIGAVEPLYDNGLLILIK